MSNMINIIDDEYQEELEESLTEEEKQARFRAKRMIAKPIQLRPEREAQFLADYGEVVVHDFGDVYHLTEEERVAQNKFYSAFKQLSLCKHKYKKLDQYVTAMREAYKCLNLVAENNGYYEPKKFKKLFYNGEIKIAGLFVPQYKGRDKKQISKEYLFEFIMSDKPAEDILPKRVDEEDYVDVDFSDSPLTDAELKVIMETVPPSLDQDDGFDEKDMRKLMKRQPELLIALKDMQKRGKRGSNLSRFVFEMSGDSLDNISNYERSKILKSMPQFKGDMTDDDAYRKYLYELKEWEDNNIQYGYNGKLKTAEEIRNIELKTTLEAAGWNLRNLYENKEKEAKLKAIKKAERKREKLLRQKLTDVENRRKRREMGEDIDSKKKLSKKKLKKLKKQGKKKIDDFLSGNDD